MLIQLLNVVGNSLQRLRDSDSVSVSLGGGGAVSLNDSLIICTGGVNKRIFLSALRRGEMLQKAKAAQCTKQIDSLNSCRQCLSISSGRLVLFQR